MEEPRKAHEPEFRGQQVGGIVLILVGIAFLLAQYIPDVGDFVVLLIGLAFLAAHALTGAYGFLIPGGILTGLGSAIALTQRAPISGTAEGGIIVLGLGLGFASIWLISALARRREHHWWPLIPGGILSLIGLGLLAGSTGERLLRLLAIWWPMALVLAGLALILQRNRSR